MSKSLPSSMTTYAADFLQLSEDLLCVADLQGTIREANALWEKTLGWNLHELKGKAVLEFIHPEDRAIASKAFEAARNEVFTPFEVRALTKSGATRWLAWRGCIDRKRSLFFGIIRDITDEKQTQQKYLSEHRQNAQLQQAIDTSALVASTDAEGRFIEVNETFCQVSKYTRAELLGKNFKDLRSPIHPATFFHRIRERLDEGRYWKGEICWQAKDGTEFWVDSACFPMFGADGTLTGHFNIHFDITRRKQIEESLESERTVAAHASRMASLGEMSAGIAHEINNPLAIIIGKVQQLKKALTQEPPLTDEALKHLGPLSDTAFRISKIINGMRSFARDASLDPFVATPVEKIIEETLPLCLAKLRDHNIELRRTPPLPGIEIDCRPAQMSQILVNLLNNAVDAIEKSDEKWVEVAMKDCGDSVEFSVMDSGRGIPADIRDKILRPFFTTKEVGKGTGLGLPIVHTLIKTHGGEFFLDTSCKNTRFVFVIPKKHVQESENDGSAAA